MEVQKSHGCAHSAKLEETRLRAYRITEANNWNALEVITISSVLSFGRFHLSLWCGLTQQLCMLDDSYLFLFKKQPWN